MNVIACYKVVPDEQDIVVRPDQTISLEKAELEISEYDLCAVEAGMQIVEAVGGKLSALSVGPKILDNSKLKKGILSRGPQELFLVVDDSLENAETHKTATTLANALKKIGDFDLVICGEGSADLYAQQVGVQLGELLNLPVINAVSKIEVEGNNLVVERTLEDEVEILEIPLPAVISVTTDINLPRIPSMKEILAAGKKPVTQWSVADLGAQGTEPSLDIIKTLAPEQAERKKIILEGDSEESVAKFFENIRREL